MMQRTTSTAPVVMNKSSKKSQTRLTRRQLAKNKVSDAADSSLAPEKEINGPKGPEPTRYGDWEKKGKCVDF